MVGRVEGGVKSRIESDWIGLTHTAVAKLKRVAKIAAVNFMFGARSVVVVVVVVGVAKSDKIVSVQQSYKSGQSLLL